MYKIVDTGIVFFVLLLGVLGEKRCNYTQLPYDTDCPLYEYCDEDSTCKCWDHYERKEEVCVPKVEDSTYSHSNLKDNQGNGSVVAAFLIPLFLIVFVMCGVYLTRKYHFLTWFRSKFQRRHENYDEFMIGQDLDDDDEPLT